MNDSQAGAARERGPRAERCARCGAPFECGIDMQRCWCSALPALRDLPPGLPTRCLCEACLRAELAAQDDRE